MKLLPELRRQILEDVLGTSYDAYVNFKREPSVPKKRQHRKRIPLWRFLIHLLNRDKLSCLVQWIDNDNFKFKIKEPNEVAKLWGSIKDKSDMTYEKLGRAMRYYYGKNIIEKVSGMRYSYRFIFSKKTSRYLARLDMKSRSDSVDSAASTESGIASEGSIESGSTYSEDYDASIADSPSTAGSPSSFLNENFDCYLSPKSIDIEVEDNFTVEGLGEEYLAIEPANERIFSQDFHDENLWKFPPDAYMDLEDAKLIKNESLIYFDNAVLDERLSGSIEIPYSVDCFISSKF